MKFQTMLGCGLAALLAISTAAYAADDKGTDSKDTTKTDTKSDAPATPTRGGGRLIKPYSDLKDLSAEQTAKIKQIHQKYLAEKKEIDAKEKEECMALLSDDQKKELVDASAKATADKKASAAAAKADKSSGDNSSK